MLKQNIYAHQSKTLNNNATICNEPGDIRQQIFEASNNKLKQVLKMREQSE